ncbi:MAG: TIGR04206 family protein [Halobellus sp.]|uniref:TIGR04206 family protein n=1 Tax=Halobellus sp. TaxID=1979212 RepID=UPI0035D3F379
MGQADNESRAASQRTPGPRATVRVAVLFAPLLLPWSIQVFTARDATFLFAWGLVNTNPLSMVSLFDFLFVYTRGLPEFILAWPLSVGCYALALASAVIGWRTGREDCRVTVGLLVVAAIAQVRLAWGFSIQPNRTAWPLATLTLLVVVWWGYWPGLRSMIR